MENAAQEFEEQLEFDGLPCLWPHPPNWQIDDEIRKKLIQRFNLFTVPEFLFTSDQREMDDRFIHMNYIADNIPEDVVLSSKEWAERILVPSGWNPPPGLDKDVVTKEAFFKSCGNGTAGGMATEYTRPKIPIPRKCDNCKRVHVSMRVRRSLYCSRKCLRENWKDHKRICATI